MPRAQPEKPRELGAEAVAQRVGQEVRVSRQVYSQATEPRKRKAAKTVEELLDDA